MYIPLFSFQFVLKALSGVFRWRLTSILTLAQNRLFAKPVWPVSDLPPDFRITNEESTNRFTKQLNWPFKYQKWLLKLKCILIGKKPKLIDSHAILFLAFVDININWYFFLLTFSLRRWNIVLHKYFLFNFFRTRQNQATLSWIIWFQFLKLRLTKVPHRIHLSISCHNHSLTKLEMQSKSKYQRCKLTVKIN
jgi:hypothetical protein